MGFSFLIAGSFENDNEEANKQKELTKALVSEILNQNHKIVIGCMNVFDDYVSLCADEAAQKNSNIDITEVFTGYVVDGIEPKYKVGRQKPSKVKNWNDFAKDIDFKFPEPIEDAEIILLIGGSVGTQRTRNWGYLKGKVIFPVARSKGIARQLYHVEEKLAKENHIYENFAACGDLSKPTEIFAKELVENALAVFRPIDAVALMPFEKELRYDKMYEVFLEACKSYTPNYNPFRVDRDGSKEHIMVEIRDRISSAAFCFVDISGARPNVMIELGYALGCNRKAVVVVDEETVLPFALQNFPVITYDSNNPHASLPEIRKSIDKFAGGQGRSKE